MNWISMGCAAVATVCFIMAVLALRADHRRRLNQVIALTSFFSAGYCWFVGLSLGAADHASFMFWTRMASMSMIGMRFASMFIILILAGVGRALTALITLPMLAGYALMIAQNWTGILFIHGYTPGPWGNVASIADDPFWLTIHSAIGWWAVAWYLVAVVIGWRNQRTRRFRVVVVYLIGATVLVYVGSSITTMLWLLRGVPDASVLMIMFPMAAYFLLMDRHRHLSEDKPDFERAFLDSVQGRLLFADLQGRIVDATPQARTLLDSCAEGEDCRDLATLFRQAPGFAAHWESFVRGAPRGGTVLATVADEQVRVRLVPHVNGYQEIDGAIVQLQPADPVEDLAETFGISPREREVANLILEGLDTREISQALFISLSTVKNHLHNLYQKTGASSRSDLVRLLLTEGARAV